MRPPTKTIWKFPLAITDRQVLPMPPGAKILSVAPQAGILTLWAEVQPDLTPTSRRVTIVGTGNPIPAHPGEFVGTAVMPPFVWHVYVDREGA